MEKLENKKTKEKYPSKEELLTQLGNEPNWEENNKKFFMYGKYQKKGKRWQKNE